MFDFLKVNRRLNDLEERLQKTEQHFREVDLEWATMYDKVRSLMGRVAKRAEVIERAAVPANGDLEDQPASQDVLATSGPSLNPRHQAIQDRILSRRRRSGI